MFKYIFGVYKFSEFLFELYKKFYLFFIHKKLNIYFSLLLDTK